MPDLAEVAAELYAMEPEEFVAARTDRVKQARGAGDRALAAAVSALPKPTIAAWLLNTLARERRDQVEELISLGDALREAQQKLAGPQLRQLSRQRHELIAAFTSMALAPAEVSGRTISADLTNQVQETLGAAIADPDAGHALLSGRLTKGLSYVGLGDVGATGPAGDRPAKPRRPPRKKDDAAERQREQRVQEARAAAERADDEAGTASARLDEARLDAERATDAVAEQRERVEELQTALAEAERALGKAETHAQATAKKVATAQQDADEAAAAQERAHRMLTDAQSEVAQEPPAR